MIFVRKSDDGDFEKSNVTMEQILAVWSMWDYDNFTEEDERKYQERLEIFGWDVLSEDEFDKMHRKLKERGFVSEEYDGVVVGVCEEGKYCQLIEEIVQKI